MTVDLRAGGACNIGPAEISRRRRMAILLSITFFAVSAVLVASHVPSLARVVVWPISAAASVTWLQVVRKFCVAYGTAGLENFGPIGAQHSVLPEQREADRKRAMQLTLEGILAGLCAAVALVYFPL